MVELIQTPQDAVTGPKCGFGVEKGHLSYPCTRPQGHHAFPDDDPEPHYAVEVDKSVRAWSAWKDRQDAKAPTEVGVHIKPEDEEGCGGECEGESVCFLCCFHHYC